MIDVDDLKLWWVIKNELYYPSFGLSDVVETCYTESEAYDYIRRNPCGNSADYTVKYVGDLIGIQRHRWMSSYEMCEC